MAIVVVAAVAVAAVAVALLRPSEQERFRSWLRSQPDIASVDEPGRALALGATATFVGARVFEPTERAVSRRPLDVGVVDRLGRAVVAYAAAHPSLNGPTVELRQGQDHVMVSASPGHNATGLQLLGAMRALPGVVAVDATVRSGSAPFTATVRSGVDLPSAATTLAAALPRSNRSWLNAALAVAVRDPSGHEVRVEVGALLTDSDARAFALAVRLDPTHPVRLTTSPAVDTNRRSVIRLADSSLTGAVASAVHDSGFGLGRRSEVVEGPTGPLPMDEQAWARSAAAEMARRTGALAARVDVGSVDDDRPVSVDLRVRPRTPFDEVLAALPAGVERLSVHTAPAPPDYARDDALVPDPEVDCPAPPDGLNIAYDGPPQALPRAANYLSALRAASARVSCAHWAERGLRGRPQTQTLLVRLPLLSTSWEPVLDVVRARRADLSSAHPTVILLLPVPGRPWTGVFNLSEGQAPSVTAIDTDSQAQTREVEGALQPLVRYWARG